MKLINANTTTRGDSISAVRFLLLSGHPLSLQVAEVAVLDAMALEMAAISEPYVWGLGE